MASKDWKLNNGAFSNDWVMNIGAYSVGEGGGGGDSGDWTSAQVTFTSTKGAYTACVPTMISEEGLVIARPTVSEGHPVTLEVPLYKGFCFTPIQLFNDVTSEPVGTGGVEYIEDEFHQGVIITGDGTLSADGQMVI